MRQPVMFKQQNPKASASMELAKRMMESGMSTAPVRHPLEGIGRLAQALSGAYIQRKTAERDTADRKEAYAALAQGVSAKPWDPSKLIGEGGPEQIIAGTPGQPPQVDEDGYEINPQTIPHAVAMQNAAPAGGAAGGAYAMSQLPDNFYAQEAMPQLQMQDAARRQERLDKETDRYNANVDRRSFAEFEASLKPPESPKTIKTAEGVFVLNPDGTLGNRLGGATTPQTNINMPPLEKKEDEAVGKFYGTKFADIQTAGSKAVTSNARLRQARRLVEAVPQSGAGAEFRLDVKKLGKALGMDVGDVSQEEGLRAIAGQISLDHIEKTKGAVSDKENARFDQISPGLSNTKEGNLLIIEIAERGNNIAREAAKIARDWRRENGSMGAVDKSGRTYEDAIAELQEKMPLFSPEIERRLSRIQQPAAAPAPAQGGWGIQEIQ